MEVARGPDARGGLAAAGTMKMESQEAAAKCGNTEVRRLTEAHLNTDVNSDTNADTNTYTNTNTDTNRPV